MAIEVTQHCIEVIRTNDNPLLRVTHLPVEVLRQADNPLLRVTQLPVEVLRQADNPLLRVTQLPVEVMRSNLAGPTARLTQAFIEVARAEPASLARLTQVNIEVSRRNRPTAKLGLPSWMVFDDDHTIDVIMVAGTAPTSAVDDLTVLNGANVAMLGNEVIQYRDVADLGDNKYRLSRLLRGRLGTEPFMNSHEINETFVILDSSTVRRVTQDAVDLNVQRYFKIVGAGRMELNAPITPFINVGVSHRPWKPAQVKGTRSMDDLTITWIRRTRVSFEWLDIVDVPLGEVDEEYEVDILDGVGTVLRILKVTAETAIYTAAEQITDFGAVQSVISVIIYQMSNIVGRGHGAAAQI